MLFYNYSITFIYENTIYIELFYKFAHANTTKASLITHLKVNKEVIDRFYSFSLYTFS